MKFIGLFRDTMVAVWVVRYPKGRSKKYAREPSRYKLPKKWLFFDKAPEGSVEIDLPDKWGALFCRIRHYQAIPQEFVLLPEDLEETDVLIAKQAYDG